MTGELRSLTSARGIAAWLVVLYHIRSGANWAPEWLMAVMHKGYLAVDFFFLLSGFVIYLSAHRTLLRDRGAAVPAFLARRFARIYPLYAFMLAATIAFATLIEATGRTAGNYPWAELPLHIVMMQNWGLTPALSWNHPAWSISAEFAAYLLLPALVLWTPIARMRRANLAGAMMLVIASMFLLLTLCGQRSLGGDIPRFGLVRCLAEFSCGTMLCAFWLRGPDAEGRSVLIAASGTLLFWGLWLLDMASEIWAFPAGAACMILALAHASGLRHNPLQWGPLHYLGQISYATYMVHFMLFIWFKIAFVENANAIPPSIMAGFLALTLGTSALLHHLVEQPGRRWLSAVRPWPQARRLERQP
jgi:peptidoglycan/LPS O-acetylase OafA/YrhL